MSPNTDRPRTTKAAQRPAAPAPPAPALPLAAPDEGVALLDELPLGPPPVTPVPSPPPVDGEVVPPEAAEPGVQSRELAEDA